MVLDKFIREAAGHFIWLLNILFVWFRQCQHQHASAQTYHVGLATDIPKKRRRTCSVWFEYFVLDFMWPITFRLARIYLHRPYTRNILWDYRRYWGGHVFSYYKLKYVCLNFSLKSSHFLKKKKWVKLQQLLC